MTERQAWPTPEGSPRYADGSPINPDIPVHGPGMPTAAPAFGAPVTAYQAVEQPADRPFPLSQPAGPAQAYAPSPAGPVAAPAGASRGNGRVIGFAVVAGLLAGLVGGLLGQSMADLVAGDPTTGVVQELPQASSDLPPLQEGSVAAVADAVLPTVVSFTVAGDGGEATGSGFVLRPDGYLLTNNHVIAGAADGGRITVTFNNGETERGTIVGRSASYDLGVVKVNRRGLTAAPLGNSEAMRVGDPVIAIGSPLGLNGTVTTGIVSSLDRPVTVLDRQDQSFISALQTDAAINPGNSGGPLINSTGQVIGVNSAIATVAGITERAGSIGVGFAIPVNQAKRIAEEIIATGDSKTPIIGVKLDTRFNGDGAKVDTITPGGPAADTDLRPGDVITRVNGQRVGDATELVVAIRAQAPGDEVVLTVADKPDVTITLGTSDDE